MQIRLIAVDMDGTLLNPEKRISDEETQALRDAAEAGIALAVCSGRMPEDISGMMRQIGISAWVCGCNGCRVLDAPFGNVVAEHTIPTQAALACIDALVARDMPVNAFAGHGLVMLRPRAASGMQEEWTQEIESRGLAHFAVGEDALRAAALQGIHKMLVFERGDGASLPELTDALRNLPGVDVTSSWVNNIEIMPGGINKGVALADIAGRLHIASEQVLAIGDQVNDREMLAWAGCAVAMGNAAPEIRTLCAYVTEDNAHGGVAKAIRRFALC